MATAAGKSRLSVVVVDDEGEMLQEEVAGLSEEGFVCWGAESVAAAEALLAEQGEQIGVVVADIRMPGKSGLDLARKLLGGEPIREVVIISGHAGSAEQQLVNELGVRELLSKPFRLELLIAAVERALQRVAAARRP
jgi:FixJ family two-component response regulator